MSLAIEGDAAEKSSFDFQRLSALPEQVKDISLHVSGREGGAVWLRDVLAAAAVSPDARYVTLAAADGEFAICVPLAPLLERALLVYRLGEGELPEAKGGPLRLLLSGAVVCVGKQEDELDGCAQVKDLGVVRVLKQREADVGHEH